MEELRFPNARKATIIMFYATVLHIINFVISVLSGLVFVNISSSDPEKAAFFFIAIVVINIIAYILSLISMIMIMYALYIGAKDDRFFSFGFILILINIAALIVLMTTQITEVASIVSTGLEYTSKISSGLINVFICIAITRLFKKMGNQKKVRHGQLTTVLIIVGILISEISYLTSTATDPERAMLHTVLTAVYVVVSLVRLLIYSAFLKYSRKNL